MFSLAKNQDFYSFFLAFIAVKLATLQCIYTYMQVQVTIAITDSIQ